MSPVRSTDPSTGWTADLIDWYGHNARDLPWRRPGTPAWAVLVSEVMLQQTPVVRVTPMWTAWMQRWPTPAALAAEPAAEAVRMWGKLGYPRRALRLHESARAIVADYDGAVPSDLDQLLALPGVGTYTARAVATFAFGQRQAVVDVNVRRVVARVVHGHGAPGPAATFRDLAAVSALLPADPPTAARLSIALMELGALVCTAVRPRCSICPVATACEWRGAGYPAFDGPSVRPQRFAGTDRQVRGRLLDVLRATPDPVEPTVLDRAWPEPLQRARALGSLVIDGLVDPLPDGRFALPGGHDEVRSRSTGPGTMEPVSNASDEPIISTPPPLEPGDEPARPDDDELVLEQAAKKAKKREKKAKKKAKKAAKQADAESGPSSARAAKDKTVSVGHKAVEVVENAVETSKDALVDVFDKAIDSIDSRMNRR